MDKKMIDSLLQTITDMTDEVEDIQSSGYLLDEFVTDIETKINETGHGLTGLQRDIRDIDQNAAKVVDKILEKKNQ